nr:putative reverse transcriptase domain-containing protein [Tanacetum cinerariifolium]
MPPRMRTRSAGWPAAKSLGGGTGVRVGRGGKGRRPRKVNDERVDDLNGQRTDQGMGANGGIEGVNGNVGNQGNGRNQNGNVVNENVQENVRNVLVNSNRVGFSYKEFLACNPKEYDGKGGAVFLTRWIEKIENVQDMSGCSIDQKVKYTAGLFVEEFCPSHEMKKLETKLWNHAMVRAGHAAYTDRFHELVRLVPYLVTPKSRNGSIKKVEKRGNVREPSKDKNGRDDNKRTRTGNIFATTEERIWVLGLRNHLNQVAANNGGQGHGNQGNQARGRAFMLGAEEARQDLNIMTDMFTLNDHFATTLFDFGADYRFVSTTFIPLLGIESSDFGFKYEIEIASGQLVKINKVIKGCKLKIKGHVFDIDFINFGHGSFDMIIGMDWLSNHKAKIICHEKVVRIPLLDGKVLRVLEEKPNEKMRQLKSAKAKDKKKKDCCG